MEQLPRPACGVVVTQCSYCGVVSTEHTFKYHNNHKADQPRYKCKQCERLFSPHAHGRPRWRTYTKVRHEDPAELKGLARDCPNCHVANHAEFKFYNNKNDSNPASNA